MVLTFSLLSLAFAQGTYRQRQKSASLEEKVYQLEQKLGNLSINQEVPKEEEERPEVVREKSQDELLTAAVAKVAPTVVSVVVSKDIPTLEVVYVNPFGDDPLFKDVGIRVPVYRQKGTELKKIGAGTGFLISTDGYIATNKHVVEDTQAHYTVLLSDGKQLQAEVIYRDPAIDFAIVKAPGSGFSKIEFGNSDTLKLGQAVFAVGNALGEYNNSVSVGVVSGLNRNIQASSKTGTVEHLRGVIQTDAAINPGNSGGPLVDLEGRIVGVNVATVIGSNNISFSIPINKVRQTIKDVLGF